MNNCKIPEFAGEIWSEIFLESKEITSKETSPVNIRLLFGENRIPINVNSLLQASMNKIKPETKLSDMDIEKIEKGLIRLQEILKKIDKLEVFNKTVIEELSTCGLILKKRQER